MLPYLKVAVDAVQEVVGGRALGGHRHANGSEHVLGTADVAKVNHIAGSEQAQLVKQLESLRGGLVDHSDDLQRQTDIEGKNK